VIPTPPREVYSGLYPPPMELSVKNFENGTKIGQTTLNKLVFGVPIRRDIVHNVVKWERAKKRCANAQTKRMKDLRGSTRKLRKQKGSGQARVGMNRRAGRVGGMKAHGPVPRDFTFKLNKKFVRLGLRVALSAKLRENAIQVVEKLDISAPKTRLVESALQGMDLHSRLTLAVTGSSCTENFQRGAANISSMKTISASELNCYDLIKHNNLLLTVDAIKELEYRLVERV